MSGTLGDGALGLRAIKGAGGLTMVQSPEDAEFGDMPLNALAKAGKVDFLGTAEERGPAICRLIVHGATNAEVAAVP
jgi:chemotaxis response regulator CheB